jgi:hypothetical protein
MTKLLSLWNSVEEFRSTTPMFGKYSALLKEFRTQNGDFQTRKLVVDISVLRYDLWPSYECLKSFIHYTGLCYGTCIAEKLWLFGNGLVEFHNPSRMVYIKHCCWIFFRNL